MRKAVAATALALLLLTTGVIAGAALRRHTSRSQFAAWVRHPWRRMPATIPVHNGDNLQAIYNAASCGDVVELDTEGSGASWTYGGDTPDHALVFGKVCTLGNEITVRSAGYTSIPNNVIDHTVFPRVMPSGSVLSNFAAIRGNNAHTTNLSGTYNIIIGLDITTIDRLAYRVSTIDEQGSHNTIDRCWPHSLEDGTVTPDSSLKYAVNTSGTFLTVKNSRLATPAGYSLGSQVVDNNYALLCETCTNLTAQNDFLSSWYAEAFTGGTQFGGATHATLSSATQTGAHFSTVAGLAIGTQVAIQQFVEDNPFAYAAVTITGISGNDVTYTAIPGQAFQANPLMPGDAQWNGTQVHDISFTQCEFYIDPTIEQRIAAETSNFPKGFFEFKSVITMTFDGCEFTGAASVLAWSANNQGTPQGCWSVWTTIKDVVVRNSFVNFSPAANDNYYAFIISTQPIYFGCVNVEGQNFTLSNNLVLHSGAVDSHSNGINVTYNHNTFINDGPGSYLLNFNLRTTQNVVYTNNIGWNHEYGLHCQNPDNGLSWPDSACFPGIDMRNNIQVGPHITDRPYCVTPYPASNQCVDTVNDVGFVNPTTNNYRLTNTSVGHNAGLDGKDIGADWNQLVNGGGGTVGLGFDPSGSGVPPPPLSGNLIWSKVTGSPDFALSLSFVGNKMYVGTVDHGVSSSTSGGAWTSANQGLGVRLEVCGDFPTCNTAPTGGTFTITYGGQTTIPIAYNAGISTIQSALDGISSLGSGGSVVSDGPLPGSFVVITPAGSHIGDDFTTMTVNSSLTGGASPGGAILPPRFVGQLYTTAANTLLGTIRVRSTTDLYRRTLGATAWTKVAATPSSGFRFDYSDDGQGNLLLVDLLNTNNVWKSTDDGVSWNQAFATLTNCGSDDRPLSIISRPASIAGAALFAGTHGLNVEFSTDHGATWQCLGAVQNPTNGSNQIRTLNAAGQPVAVGQFGQIFLHVGGSTSTTWNFQTGYPYSNTNYTTHDMVQLPNGMLVVHGGRPYSSTDGGATWKLNDGGIPPGTLANFDGGGSFATFSHTMAVGPDGRLYMAIVNQLAGWGVYSTLVSPPSGTWYVRSDGGSQTQCTGTRDALYPGVGFADCAFSNPQDALDNAGQGDTISIRAGDTFTTTTGFSITHKPSGTGYITIQSSDVTNLPAGIRVSPAVAFRMPKLVANTNNIDVLHFAANADHYMVIGIEITSNPANSIQNALVTVEAPSQTSLSQVPNDVIFDRDYVHGGSNTSTNRRGFQIGSSNTTIKECYVENFKELGADSQAIAGWNGPGPYTITDNFLEGATQNILFGGTASGIPNLTPDTIDIEDNTLFKRLSWNPNDPSYAGTAWDEKNALDLRNATHVTFKHNTVTNVWCAGQQHTVALTPQANGTANPSASVGFVTIQNNLFQNICGGVNMKGDDASSSSGITHDVTILNNLWILNGSQCLQTGGSTFAAAAPNTTVVRHNTFINTFATMVRIYLPTQPNWDVRDNIWRWGTNGFATAGGGPISSFWTGTVMITKNGFIGGPVGFDMTYAGNYYPINDAAVQFINPAAGNYGLLATSPLHSAASDSTDVGANMTLLPGGETVPFSSGASGKTVISGQMVVK